MPDRHAQIQRSYKQLGGVGGFNDGIVTRSTLTGKLVDSVIWGLNGEKAAKRLNDALSPIPEGFGGALKRGSGRCIVRRRCTPSGRREFSAA